MTSESCQRVQSDMVAPLVAACVIGWQNPAPPGVTLPEGWKVKYWSSLGHGTGALIGPKGEEIIFPGYEPTGAMAATTREADPSAILVKAILDGRRVDVAAKSDGFVAISYPPLIKDYRGDGYSFDYWTKTKSSRQAAQAVMIGLTRLEVRRDQDRDDATLANAEQQFSVAREFPFRHLSVAWGYQYFAPTILVGPRFETYEGVKVVLENKIPPVKNKWEDKATLLEREIRWAKTLLAKCGLRPRGQMAKPSPAHPPHPSRKAWCWCSF